ncbi:MAG TPA: efflux RND transporter periplasmic adaptor subunit, partial [Tepidisphaeraceae bacterium]|nr:efflux RND transporter periplasmic adaptor subunit [Tepidisphaeraceae bacterium]
QVALAQTNFQRTEQAVKGNAVSQQEYDTAKAQLEQAQAVLAGDKAAAEQSRLNLEWCRVTAPIDGRVSNKLVTPGNLVNGGAGQATLLTTITSLDPMYCYVDVDERSVLKYQELSREKKRVSARDSRIPCFLQLSNETNFPHEGVVDFVDNHIDPATGTIRARGVYANPNGYLTPGMFGRVRIPGSGRYRTVLIPDAAIGTDQNIRYVLLVGTDDVVQSRPVTLGPLFGGLRSIEKGLSVNDEVVINGLLRARPGTKVAPQWSTINIDMGMLTAPGSPTTQSLPATRSIPSTVPTNPDAAAAELHATSQPSTASAPPPPPPPPATEGAAK